jgi:type III secretory pathway component EscU
VAVQSTAKSILNTTAEEQGKPLTWNVAVVSVELMTAFVATVATLAFVAHRESFVVPEHIDCTALYFKFAGQLRVTEMRFPAL